MVVTGKSQVLKVQLTNEKDRERDRRGGSFLFAENCVLGPV
jgi:hypothetical protein